MGNNWWRYRGCCALTPWLPCINPEAKNVDGHGGGDCHHQSAGRMKRYTGSPPSGDETDVTEIRPGREENKNGMRRHPANPGFPRFHVVTWSACCFEDGKAAFCRIVQQQGAVAA